MCYFLKRSNITISYIIMSDNALLVMNIRYIITTEVTLTVT